VLTVVSTYFRNREEELKNALATSRNKVRDLEMRVREIKAGGPELKRAMKEATDSEYAISQKLAYETAARRGLQAEFEVVLKSLQSDQITIAGYEVELNDLKGAANYAMSCIPVLEEGEQQQSIVDRLIDTPNRLLTLLRVTGLADATNALVRVKSHYLEVDMAKIKGGADTTKDLQALELEVDDAATEVMENINFKGDGGAGGGGGGGDDGDQK
jgi:chromosome segregation ATPase